MSYFKAKMQKIRFRLTALLQTPKLDSREGLLLRGKGNGKILKRRKGEGKMKVRGNGKIASS